jgi:dihydrofolate reductase
MRTLASFIATTLDGYCEGPNQELDWMIVDDEFTAFSIEQLQRSDTLVFGRITYTGMAEYWSSADGIADNPIEAPLLNDTPKIVVSSTLADGDAIWSPTQIIGGDDLVGGFTAAKERDGGELLVLGSPTLTMGLAEAGLLDELRLLVAPVALHAGKPVFGAATDRVPLDLLDIRRFDSGNVLLTYRPGP